MEREESVGETKKREREREERRGGKKDGYRKKGRDYDSFHSLVTFAIGRNRKK